MATSLHRRNRRRRKAGALVATGAAAALLAGGLTPPAPAQAFSFGNAPMGCVAGHPEVKEIPGLGAADCTEASPAILAKLGDGILGLFMPDLAVSLSGFNGALGVPLSPRMPGSATIKGTGFNTAIGASGKATAQSDHHLAAAIAVALSGGVANAESLFGLALAVSGGGADAILNPPEAKAKALPFGIAVANSSNLLESRTVSATALGGVGAGLAASDFPEQAVCTALYAEASVKTSSGGNVDSCTSVLFIFQKSKSGDGADVYAIKNPFDIALLAPLGDAFAESLATVLDRPGMPEGIADMLSGKIIPKFDSDIIRISFENGMPKLGTDLPEWIGGLFESLAGLVASTGTSSGISLDSVLANAGGSVAPQAAHQRVDAGVLTPDLIEFEVDGTEDENDASALGDLAASSTSGSGGSDSLTENATGIDRVGDSAGVETGSGGDLGGELGEGGSDDGGTTGGAQGDGDTNAVVGATVGDAGDDSGGEIE